MLSKNYCCALLSCLCTSFISAQTNLVPNPSFEDTIQCPGYLGQLYYATGWYDATGASPEYFHSCTDSIYVDVPLNFWGNQAPRTGNAYAGFGIAYDFGSDYREYLQVQLTSTLAASVVYNVEFFVSLSDTSSLAVSSMGLYFSDTAITGPMGEVLNVIPQISNPPNNFLTDTLGWIQISGTYVASGTENFITIGNFQADSNTLAVPVGEHAYSGAYYFIDDVSVSTPLKNTIPEENGNQNPEVVVYPNPSGGLFTISSSATKGTISVCNVIGAVVYESAMTASNAEIDLTGMNSGIYFVTFRTEAGSVTEKVVIR